MTDWEGTEQDDGHSLSARFPDLSGRIRMLWHAGYWDGPLSGYVMLDGVPGYWVHCVQDYWNERAVQADACCRGECDCCKWSDLSEGLTRCPDYTGGTACCKTTWDRLYLVYKLDAEQERLHMERHELFCEHVGTHTNYDVHGERAIGRVKSRESHALFYKAELSAIPPLREEQVVGITTELFPQESK